MDALSREWIAKSGQSWRSSVLGFMNTWTVWKNHRMRQHHLQMGQVREERREEIYDREQRRGMELGFHSYAFPSVPALGPRA